MNPVDGTALITLTHSTPTLSSQQKSRQMALPLSPTISVVPLLLLLSKGNRELSRYWKAQHFKEAWTAYLLFLTSLLYDSKVFLHKNHFKTKQDKRSWKDVNGHLISHHGSCQNGWKWRKCLSCLTIYTVLCIVKTIEFESEIECFATIEFDHRIFQKPDVLETLGPTHHYATYLTNPRYLVATSYLTAYIRQ